MLSEDEQLKELYLQENSKKEQARMEEEAKEVRESELNEKWRKLMLEQEIEKNQLIQQLIEASVNRQKNSKGKKKKKKKWLL